MRPFRLNWGYFGGSTNKAPGSTTNRDSSVGQRNSSQNNRRSNQGDSNYQIYVGDLDMTVTKQQLMDHFRKKYNSVADGKIIMDQSTKISKGYGFVQFSNYEESQKALTEMQGSFLKGKPVKVSQGISRNSGNSQGPSHSRNVTNQTMNPAIINQVYGAAGYLNSGNGNNPSNGSILGGLGVQFKPPEGMGHPLLALPPQHYAYLQQGNPSQSVVFE